MWMIAFGVLGTLVLLVICGLSNQHQILRDWEMVLSPWSEEAYGDLGERVAGESRMAEYAFRRAFAARASGSRDEAVRLLEVGLRVVERTSPDMITLLRGMALVSRMASAVAVVTPLQPRAFRLPALTVIAFLGALGHHVLVSTAERLRLRAYLLRRGFRMVVRFLLTSTERIRSERPSAERDWDRIAAAREDLRTLSAESVLTFRALLKSLVAQPR